MTKTAAPALVISTAAGQPPIGKPLIVQARGQLRLTWKLYAESPQSGEISRPYGTVSMEQETLPPLSAPASAGDDDSGRQHTVISKGEKMTKTAAPALVISTKTEWRNLIPQMTGTSPHPSSFRPKRSGVEKSHSLMLHRTLGQEISRL